MSPHQPRRDERAFVVQFSSNDGTSGPRYAGRVEQLASGEVHRFESLAGLARCFEHMLAAGHPGGDEKGK